MLVGSGAEKRGVAAGIFRRARLKILDDFGFRKRAGEIQRFAQAKFFRNRGEQVFDRLTPIAASISWRSDGLLGR